MYNMISDYDLIQLTTSTINTAISSRKYKNLVKTFITKIQAENGYN